MAQVVRCTDCGAYYNGQYYSVCPHCKKGHAESVPKPEQTDAPQKPDVKKDEPSVYVLPRNWLRIPMSRNPLPTNHNRCLPRCVTAGAQSEDSVPQRKMVLIPWLAGLSV